MTKTLELFKKVTSMKWKDRVKKMVQVVILPLLAQSLEVVLVSLDLVLSL